MGTCHFGVNCTFSHDIPPEGLTAGRKMIPCKWFHQNGSCRFGSRCHFSHTALEMDDGVKIGSNGNSIVDEGERVSLHVGTDRNDPHAQFNCGVCFEDIVRSGKRFGLMSSCDHCFCIDCLRTWRRQSNKNDQHSTVTQACPTCRVQSKLVVPSKKFAVGSEKQKIFEGYKKRMEKMPCRYFDGSIGSCPFGRSCFYAHLDWDGEDLKANDVRRSSRNTSGSRPSNNVLDDFEVVQVLLMQTNHSDLDYLDDLDD